MRLQYPPVVISLNGFSIAPGQSGSLSRLSFRSGIQAIHFSLQQRISQKNACSPATRGLLINGQIFSVVMVLPRNSDTFSDSRFHRLPVVKPLTLRDNRVLESNHFQKQGVRFPNACTTRCSFLSYIPLRLIEIYIFLFALRKRELWETSGATVLVAVKFTELIGTRRLACAIVSFSFPRWKILAIRATPERADVARDRGDFSDGGGRGCGGHDQHHSCKHSGFKHSKHSPPPL